MNYQKDAAQGLKDQAMARGMYGSAAHNSLGVYPTQMTTGLDAPPKPSTIMQEIEQRLQASNDMLQSLATQMTIAIDAVLGSEPKEISKGNPANVNHSLGSQINESLEILFRNINTLAYEMERLKRII